MPTRHIPDPQDWKRMCVGREADMKWLIERWERAKAGTPQLCVLVGDIGLGKTRLAQEFYRWLTRHEDPSLEGDDDDEGYWPDAFGGSATELDPNPVFPTDDDQTRPPIPFLWWGLRGVRPDDRHRSSELVALQAGRSVLYPHTHAIEEKRKLKSSRAKRATDAAKTVGGALYAPIGLVFAISDTLKAGWDQLRDEGQSRQLQQRTTGEVFQQQHQDLIDLALQDFRTILNPEDRGAPNLPVILLVDDAQWLDTYTLQFLRRLITAAETRGTSWPLMIIATHREEEWHTSVPQDEEQRTTAFNQLPPLLRYPDQWDGQRVLHKIADKLMEVSRRALPGVSGDHHHLLTAKADGNPELLQEIIDELLAEPRHFVDQDIAKGLTDEAVRRINNELFTLDGQYKKRFRRLGPDAQRVLGWSSRQGLRFLTQITHAVAEQIDTAWNEEQVRATLRRAERPGCCVQLLEYAGRRNLGEFRQRVFQELAADHLGFDQDEQAAVAAATRDVLTQWIDHGAVDELPEEERRDALLMARRELRPDADSPDDDPRWKTWGAALVQLMKDYEATYLWDQAVEVAAALADARPDGWSYQLVRTWDQIAVVDLLYDYRDFARARRILEPLLAELDELRERAKPEFDLWHDVGALIQRHGDMAFAEGAYRTAADAFGRLIDLSRAVVDQFGSTPEALRDVSVSLSKVGDIDQADGDLPAARGRYEESLQVCREIIERFGATPEALRDVSVSLGNVADIDRADGDLPAARRRYEESLQVQREIIERFGATPEALRDISVSLNKVGNIDRADGDLPAARGRYEESLQVRREIIERFGATPEALRDVSVSLNRVGDIDQADGDLAAARERYEESLQVRREIIERFGATPEALRDISVSLDRVGDIDRADGDLPAARVRYEESLQVCREIIERFGATPEALRDISVSLSKVGDIDQADGDLPAARKRYKESLQVFREIIERFEATPQALRDVSVSLDRVGDIDRADGDLPAARGRYEESLQVCREIIERFGATPEALRDEAVSLERMATIERGEGNRDTARGYYRQARERYEAILRDFPTPGAVRSLGILLVQFGVFELENQQRAAARECLERARDLFAHLIENDVAEHQDHQNLPLVERLLQALDE